MEKQKKKKLAKPKKRSELMFEDLRHHCLFILVCDLCKPKKNSPPTIHEDCTQETLMGRARSDKHYHNVRKSPKNYGHDKGLCEHANKRCVRGNICGYPHSEAERRMWKACLQHDWSVQEFQKDLRILVLKYSQKDIWKDGITLKNVCKQCLNANKISGKIKHTPFCREGHGWSQRNEILIVCEAERYIPIDSELKTDLQDTMCDIAMKLRNVMENGFSYMEIWNQYNSLNQKRTAMQQEARTGAREFPSRRVEFDFYPPKAPPKRREYDAEFEDILDNEDIDSEYEPSDTDENDGDVRKSPYYNEIPKFKCIEILVKEPEKYKLCKIHLEGSQNATCKPLEETGPDIKIYGRHNCGRAFDGDEVVVEIVKWTEKETDRERDIVFVNKDGHVIEVVKEKDTDVAIEHIGGRVVRVMKHCTNRDAYVFACVVDTYAANLMVPLCSKAPKIHVLDNPVQTHNRDPANFNSKRVCVCKRGDDGFIKPIFDDDDQPRYEVVNPSNRKETIFIVKYEKWGKAYVYPFGYVAKIISAGTDLKKANLILNLEYQLPSRHQSMTMRKNYDQIIEELASDTNTRTDLTKLRVFSIDPEGTQDIDDALSVEHVISPTEYLIKVGIHISDVTALVKKGSELDKSATMRRTSYYGIAPKDTVHMLPVDMATNYCSLLPDKKRLAISCFIYFDKNGSIVKRRGKYPKFMLSVIENKQKLTYATANEIIKSSSKDASNWLRDDLNTLLGIALQLREKRKHNPALNSDTRTVIHFGTDSSLDEGLESHVLVEEFMILVNTIAAETISRAQPEVCILRKQDKPNYADRSKYNAQFENITNTLLFLQPYAKCLPKPREDQPTNEVKPKIGQLKDVHLVNAFSDRLKAVCMEGDFDKLTSLVATNELIPSTQVAHTEWIRMQSPAEVAMTNAGQNEHFTLQQKAYTWFSSPIRRFIDMVNHRILKSIISLEDIKRKPYHPRELELLCTKFNKTYNRQQLFSKELARMQAFSHLKSFPIYIPCPIQKIDEDNIEFVVPFLKNIRRKETSMAYGNLALSCRPQTQASGLKISWERRVYEVNAQGRTHARANKDDIKTLNSQWHIQKPIKGDFEELIGAILQHNSMTAFEKAGTILSQMTNKKSPEITSEMKNKVPIVKHHAKFNITMEAANVLQVQVGAHCESGLLGLSIDRICLSEKLAICTEHMREPIRCFASIAEKKSKTHYRDIQEYQETWLPILAMEAITNAVQDGDPVIVHDIKINVQKHNSEYFGHIVFSRDFLRERAIHFITHASDDEEDSQDYLCLKIPVRTSGSYLPKGNKTVSQYLQWRNHWVAHALVTHVQSETPETREDESMTTDIRKKENETTQDSKLDMKEKVMVEFQLLDYHESMTKQLLGKDGQGKHLGSIEFLSKNLPDRRMYNALTNLDKANDLCTGIVLGNILNSRNIHMDKKWSSMIPDGTFDIAVNKAVDKRGNPLPLYPNNPKQTEAIRESLRRRFTIIQGPPGTGKTITGVKLLFWFSKMNSQYHSTIKVRTPKLQVMYCAPSNSAVDVAARALYIRLAEKCPKMVRVFSESIHKQAFPIPRELTSSNKLRPYEGFNKDEMEQYALHYLIRNENKQGQRAKEIKELDEKFRKVAPEKIKDAEIARYQDLVKKASIEELSKYDIILCTCSVSASPRIQRGCNIRQCVIDESGMCMETETLVPLISLEPQPEQVVLIGDHKQLRPIVMNNTARHLGLEKSLFERYAVMKQAKLIMLNEQYRMNEKICEFPSTYFYEGKLITRITNYWKASGELPTRVWPKQAPFVFCHVEGSEETMTVATQDGNEQSKWNRADARQTIRIFLEFTSTLRVHYKRITILSQYKAQVKYIEKELKDSGYENPNVSTVVSSQGDEWDYVILSTVRSLPYYQIDKRPSIGWLKRNLGFIIDHNQINVAITRARKGLIIVGNKHLLRCDNDPKTGLWNHLLEFYHEKGCLVDADNFPVRLDEARYRRYRMVEQQTEQMTYDIEEEEEKDVLLPVLPPRLIKKTFKRKY